MSFPEALKTFRSQLSFRRGQKRSVYEVLVHNINDDAGTKLIQAEVFNNEKQHWAIGCANHVLSFVWKYEDKKGCVSEVVGAQCMVFPNFRMNMEGILNGLGIPVWGLGELRKGVGTVSELQ
jgi:hypothetical protein